MVGTCEYYTYARVHGIFRRALLRAVACIVYAPDAMAICLLCLLSIDRGNTGTRIALVSDRLLMSNRKKTPVGTRFGIFYVRTIPVCTYPIRMLFRKVHKKYT